MEMRNLKRALIAMFALALSMVVATPASAATASFQANPGGTVTVDFSGVTSPVILICPVGAPLCTRDTATYFIERAFLAAPPFAIAVGENAQRVVGGTDTIVTVEAGTYKFIFISGGTDIATLASATLGSGGSTSSSVPAPQHTLDFNANGGTCTVTDSGLVIDGVWITVPTAKQCTRPGYTLLGWNPRADGGDPLGFDPGGWTVMTGDNTLYAIWVPAPEVR
jgi:hypothetical protein